jgi:NitT/TauT family transport system substrate-binding protein
MKKTRCLLILIILILVNSCCCDRNEDNVVSVRLQWFDLAQFAGFYCAEDQGFYRDSGLIVTINPGGPDFNAITLVANGSETFGVGTADQILLAQNRGVPITIIAAIFREDPNVYMVKKDSEIFTPKDFKYHTITTVFGRSTETVLNAILKAEGISINEVTIEPFPYNLQTFLNGDVDVSAAYVYDHPYQAEKLGMEVRIINPSDFGIKFYSDCIFVRNSLIEKNPAIVQKFISGTLKGWQYALDNKKDAVASTIARSPQLDIGSQEYMLEAAEPLILAEDSLKIGFIENSSITQMVRILQDQDQLPEGFDINNTYTNKFVSDFYDHE